MTSASTRTRQIADVSGLQAALNTKYDAGNDGAGSGLDADLIKGYNPPSFVSDATAATGGVAVGEIYVRNGKLTARLV